MITLTIQVGQFRLEIEAPAKILFLVLLFL